MVVRNRHASDMAGVPVHENVVSTSRSKERAHSDFSNIILLMFLYIMQGIPLGLSAVIPYMLQSDANTASYKTQATFSLASWPFSLKLVWAPIVDSIYSTRIGRRKTWLIPVQYAIGIDLLVLAYHVDEWLGREPGNPWGALGVANPVDIGRLTAAFFGLTLLAATQDIAVDGWAITMLAKENLGWASTCNTVGQTLGYVVAFILFLSLESPSICNTYLRLTPVEGKGLVTFSGFLCFWGVSFLVTTTIVALLKHESPSTFTRPVERCLKSVSQKIAHSSAMQRARIRFTDNRKIANNAVGGVVEDGITETTELDDYNHEDAQRLRLLNLDSHLNGNAIENADGSNRLPAEDAPDSDSGDSFRSNEELSLFDTYRVMLGVLMLKPVLLYILLLFMTKACFSAADSVTGLKLLEHGVPKERLAFLGLLLLPFQALLPLLVTRWTNGPRPLGTYTLAILPRLCCSAVVIPLIYYTPYFRDMGASVTASLNETLLNDTANIPHSSETGPISFPWTFYAILMSYLAAYSILSNFMFVTQMAYHAKISDPLVGGTYMTLLNTAANLAANLPSTLLLYLVEPLSVRSCLDADPMKAGIASWQSSLKANITGTPSVQPPAEDLLKLGSRWLIQNATCVPPQGDKGCRAAGGRCVTNLDGFYLEVAACLLLGFVTLPTIMRPLSKYLDSLPSSAYSFRLKDAPRCGIIRGRRRRRTSAR
ncbi:unnamed protein product [Calicophoron daubneyi]